MKPVSLCLIFLALAGCSAGSSSPASTSSNASLPTSTSANPLPVSGATPSPTLPGSVTPTTLPAEDWKTLTSPDLHLALNYPPDWSADEGDHSLTFTSPGGAKIELAVVDTGSLTPEGYLAQEQLPNTRCSSRTNPNGINIRTCFDTIAFSTTAYFSLPAAQGASQLLSLTLFDRQDLQVFNTMLDTLRPA